MSKKTWKDIEGWFNFSDLYSNMVKKYKNHNDVVFVEIGTWVGKSIAYLATEVKNNNSKIKIYGIDNFIGTINNKLSDISKERFNGDFYDVFLQNMEDCDLKEYITPIRKPSLEAVKEFEDNSIDFLFIDGDHSYNAVIKDINAWYRKVKRGGVMAGHDLPQRGVTQALNEFTKANNITYKNVSKSCWIIRK